MHVTNLGYLEDRAPHVTRLLDCDTEELNLGLGLDYVTTISDNDDEPPTDLSNSEDKWVKKKAQKAWRHQQRKITLIQTTSFANISTPLATDVGSPLSAISGSSMSSALVGDTSAGIGALLTTGGGLLSPIGDVDSTSTVSDNGLLSLMVGSISSTSAVVGCGSLSPVARGVSSASAVFGDRLLFPFADGVGSASALSGGSFFFSIADDDPLSLVGGRVSPSVGSQLYHSLVLHFVSIVPLWLLWLLFLPVL